MVTNIDYDRGVLIRSIETMGLDVFMYVDEPGIYRNAHGTEVSEELARKAGFPVDDFAKQRRLKARMKQAMDKIKEEELAQGETKKVIKERSGFTIIDIGMDRYRVLDPDGDALTQQPLSLPQAEIVFDQLVPDEQEVKDDKGEDLNPFTKATSDGEISAK